MQHRRVWIEVIAELPEKACSAKNGRPAGVDKMQRSGSRCSFGGLRVILPRVPVIPVWSPVLWIRTSAGPCRGLSQRRVACSRPPWLVPSLWLKCHGIDVALVHRKLEDMESCLGLDVILKRVMGGKRGF